MIKCDDCGEKATYKFTEMGECVGNYCEYCSMFHEGDFEMLVQAIDDAPDTL